MDSLFVQTSAGPLGFLGRLHADRPRPVLLVMRGAFPPKEHLHDLADVFREANVLIANLGGMGGSWVRETTIAELVAGLDEALVRLVPDLPIVAFGSSTGNLLMFGLKSPHICRFVAEEPFFQTEDLWPLIDDSRRRMRIDNLNPQVPRFLWKFFGIGPDKIENRDYRHLLDRITVPTDVVVAESPLLPERETDTWPSFTSPEERALLAAIPLVTLHTGPKGSGHAFGMSPPGRALIQELLRAALLEAAQLCS